MNRIMKSFSEMLLEKLRVTKNISTKPKLVGKYVVSCTIEFFFKWLIGVDQNASLTQEDFEFFEILQDESLRNEFKTYENFFDWYEDNKDETIQVGVSKNPGKYSNLFFYDDITFWFNSYANLIDVVK